MVRVTVTLPDEVHRALKEASAVRRRTIGELVAESVVAYGIKPREEAERLVARARERSRLGADQALKLATGETQAARASRTPRTPRATRASRR